MKRNKQAGALTVLMVLMLAISACGGSATDEVLTAPVGGIRTGTDAQQQAENITEFEVQMGDLTNNETKEPAFDQSGYFPIEGEGVELPDLPVEWEEDEIDGEQVTEVATDATEPPTTEVVIQEPTENVGTEETLDGGSELPDSSFDGDF